MVAVMPLAVAGLDFLPLWADERFLPADAALGEAAFDVHGGRGGALVGGVLPCPVLVEGVLSVAGLAVLEGDAALVVEVGGAWSWAVRGAVGGGWVIGVCSWVSGIGGVLGGWRLDGGLRRLAAWRACRARRTLAAGVHGGGEGGEQVLVSVASAIEELCLNYNGA